MLKTPLYDRHISLGARLVEFAGYSMPVLYSSIIDEHLSTRSGVTLFDVSHMGELRLVGEGALSLLQKLIPTRMDKLSPGKAMYSVLCDENGGVIDDLFIYMISKVEFMLVVNAATRFKDRRWIQSHAGNNIDIIDESDNTFKIDLQGPRSGEVLHTVFPAIQVQIKNLPRFCFLTTEYRGYRITISQSGYTGEYGFEIYGPSDAAVSLWDDILEAGIPMGIKPAGLGARNTLRLEAGLSLYGHELSENISPVEAGLGWLVSSREDYIGRDILINQKEKGTERTMICLVMDHQAVPRDGNTVIVNESEAGSVTSGTYSPIYRTGIAMAIVKKGNYCNGDPADIVIRNKKEKCHIAARPLYHYRGK